MKPHEKKPCRVCLGFGSYFRAFPLPSGWLRCKCGAKFQPPRLIENPA